MENEFGGKMPAVTTAQLDDWFQKLRIDTITFVYPVLIIGAALSFVVSYTGDDWVWGKLVGIGLIGLVFLLHQTAENNFLFAACMLVSASFLGVAAAAYWSAYPIVLVLFLFPVGFAAILFGFRTAVGIAGLCSVATLVLLPSLNSPPSGLGIVTLYSIWGGLGLVWIVVRHLLNSMEYIWNTYEENRDLVRQSRDSQLELLQSIEDLKEANAQLTRLNRLAQTLRFEAEQERSTKARFVANVSHELRTPLNMIVGFCEVIIKTPEIYGSRIPPALMADLDVVLRNAEHLSNLINDVLDLSQIDAGQMAISREEVDFPAVVVSAVEAVKSLFLSKGLYVRTTIDPAISTVFCDPVRIREVLLNLLSNAGRFVIHGGVEITVYREEADVLVSVSDTGPGIDDTEKGKLFKPFHQLDFTIQRRMGGTGLGLSISKGFVELHGGKMWVEGEKGKGTTFFFRLPLVLPTMARRGPSRWFIPDAQMKDWNRQRARSSQIALPLLGVVENGDVLQLLLARHLQNVEVVPFSNIQDALKSAATDIYQALLVNDLLIPAALSAISAKPNLPSHLPIIFCDVPDRNRINLELDLSDYLIKPVSSVALLRAIDRLPVSPKNILLVDDNLDAIKLLRRFLASANRGYRVLQATNGLQALEILEKNPVDLILMDIVMPEMDGIQFLQTRNTTPALREIPVILTTARDPHEQSIACGTIAVTYRDGISLNRLVDTVEGIINAFSTSSPPAGPTPLEKSPA